MGIKVSQMPSTNTLTDNDLVMVVQDNENKKINKKDLQNNLTDPSLTKRVEELEKENAYLNNLVEQAFDKKEVEGEELSINDTIEAKMNVSLYGNTKQETTTGKNLVNETQNYETLIEEIDKVLDNITITLKDFERKKKVYLSNQMFIFNNIIAINNFILDSVIYEHKLEEKIFEIIDKLNYKDMLEVIKQLNLKNKSIVIVEKKEDLGYN